jgi:hypothetical protein
MLCICKVQETLGNGHEELFGWGACPEAARSIVWAWIEHKWCMRCKDDVVRTNFPSIKSVKYMRTKATSHKILSCF